MNDLLYGSKKYWYCPALSRETLSASNMGMIEEHGPVGNYGTFIIPVTYVFRRFTT